MPTIGRIGPFRFFYSNEGTEPRERRIHRASRRGPRRVESGLRSSRSVRVDAEATPTPMKRTHLKVAEVNTSR
jgi:hypothetical protein